MLPQKRKEVEETGNGRGGFEVRVIGGNPQARVPGPEGEGVEIGLRIGAAAPEPQAVEKWDDEEPVHRLEAENDPAPLRIRATSDVGPAEPHISRSAQKKRAGIQQLTFWLGVASCVIAVAATAGIVLLKKPAASTAVVEDEFPASAISPEELEKAYFVENAATLTEEAEALLKRYAAAKSVTEVLPLVRDSERVQPKLKRQWKAWASAPREVLARVDVSLSKPAMVLSGTDADFSHFSATFTRESGGLKLDWEASYGSGDLEISDLRAGIAANASMIRAVIRPDKFYTVDFPEDKFASYQLLDKEGEVYVWAFAPLGSEAAEQLKALLWEGSSILKADESARATLRLTGPVKEGANYFLITEMLHKGWVSP